MNSEGSKKPTSTRILFIAGLSGAGKTKLSVELALAMQPAEVINMDTLQLYKGADVMTAKITQAEMKGVPHQLFSILNPEDTDFNVLQFQKEFWSVVQDIQSRGALPIAVGGTHYYIEAILGEHVAKVDTLGMLAESLSHEQKEAIKESLAVGEYQVMMNCLKNIDNETAKGIVKNDIRRLENTLKRLLLKKEESKEPQPVQSSQLSSPSQSGPKSPNLDDFFIHVLDTDSIEWFEARLLKRINSMVYDEGGLEEIINILGKLALKGAENGEIKQDADLQTAIPEYLQSITDKGVMQAIGYKEFIPFLATLLKLASSKAPLPTTPTNLAENCKLLLERSLEELRTALPTLKPSTATASTAPTSPQELSSLSSVLSTSISTLHAHTILLTKKQRKYLINRLLPSLSEKRYRVYNVQSVEGFMQNVLPQSIEITKQWLSSSSNILTNSNSSSANPHVAQGGTIKKKDTTEWKCEDCNIQGIGLKEKKDHETSKAHWAVRRRKKKAAAANVVGQPADVVKEAESEMKAEVAVKNNTMDYGWMFEHN